MKLESVIDFLDEFAAECVSAASEHADLPDTNKDLQYAVGVLIAARNHILGVSPE